MEKARVKSAMGCLLSRSDKSAPLRAVNKTSTGARSGVFTVGVAGAVAIGAAGAGAGLGFGMGGLMLTGDGAATGVGAGVMTGLTGIWVGLGEGAVLTCGCGARGAAMGASNTAAYNCRR
jgi:hypothetical protein